MRERILNVTLMILLGAVVALTWAVQRDPTVRNYEFIPEMFYSVPFEAQSANPNFADGMTARTPVPGTIARGALPIRYGTTPEETTRAGAELQNPFTAEDEVAMRRGTAVYASFCVPCHGPTAQGDGEVTQYGFPAPPSLLTEKARSLRDGQLFHIIHFGQGNMPSLATQVRHEDIWKVILQVRAFQAKAAQ